MDSSKTNVVMISADTEWGVVREYYCSRNISSSPYGEWFIHTFKIKKSGVPMVIMHGGWGKVAAAASTQYAIDCWQPRILINLGTCGGFDGEINLGEIILVNKTVIYDIYEQMGNPEDHITHYITELDNSWISRPFPLQVRQTLLVSGDRDIFANEIPKLKIKYHACAGDWESGAIAWVANKNHTRCMILRGVTDLVGSCGGDAYDGKISFYSERTKLIMKLLLDSLPQWILRFTVGEYS
jgi:adenosylhomocysteine nucleosidase